jgi:hypothetical protein
MKYSEAMLKGFEMVGGKQCKDEFYLGSKETPTAICALGAINLGADGNAASTYPHDFVRRFTEVWGEDPQFLNDGGMPWEHIYGMAVAAGL